MAAPLSVHGMLTEDPVLAAFGARTGHAHELLFGYALAVVAGFLVTRVSTPRLALLFGLWLTARATYLLLPQSLLALAGNLAFVGLVAGTVAPKLMKGAKKLRNKAFAPVILAMVLVAAAFHGARAPASSDMRALAIGETVLLFALLMLLMGGRIIAPAVAGAIQRAGGQLEARVQPRLESALLAAMAIAIVSAPVAGAGSLAGLALLVAGILTAIRLLRWRLWRCRAHPDLLCLGAGYAWLALGLCLLGSAYAFGLLERSVATHAVTVGALGTLTTTVMARTRLLRVKRDPSAARSLPVIATLMALAAALRIVFAAIPAALWSAAVCWSVGLLLLAVILLRIPFR